MIYLASYLLLTALSIIFIHNLGVQLPDMLMIFLTTSFAILFFHALNWKTILPAYKKLLQVKGVFVSALIAVAVMWLGTFLISINYTPAIQVFNFVGFTSLFGSGAIYLKNRTTSALIKALAILAVLLAFYIVYYQHSSGVNFILLLLGSILMGTASYYYLLSSAKLHKLAFKTTEILAVRFWLLWLIPLFFVIQKHQYVALDSKVILQTFFLSLITLIIPIFCSQKAVEKIGANLTGLLIGLLPCVTFILELVILKTAFDAMGYFSVGLAIAIIAPTCIPYLFSIKKWLAKRQPSET